MMIILMVLMMMLVVMIMMIMTVNLQALPPRLPLSWRRLLSS